MYSMHDSYSINDLGMYHVREHETDFFGRLDAVVHEFQRAFVQYILVQHVPTLKKNYCERYCERK